MGLPPEATGYVPKQWLIYRIRFEMTTLQVDAIIPLVSRD
jgi:hypothetical protein